MRKSVVAERIPVAGPWITRREVEYVADAAANAWYANANAYQQRFEQAFARYLDARFAVALPSCTAAIHLALAALGIGPGDEVVVPDITWIGTSAPITYLGATPVFADIDEVTWCLSPRSLEASITPRTKAVIPVDLYGNVADMDAVRRVAQQRGVAVVEDAAEAVGAQYRGRQAGSLGDAGVFSFHGSKTLTTGEGGMLVTDRQDVHDRVLFLRDHGRQPGDRMFWNTEVAFKYRMSALQAALGLAQLERVEELVTRKREIFGWYHEELAGAEGVELNREAAGTKSSYWMVTAVLDPDLGIGKEQVMRWMDDRNVDCRPFFHPLSSLPAYRALQQAREARERNAVAYAISPFGVNLPSALTLTQEQVRYVCGALRELLRRPGRS